MRRLIVSSLALPLVWGVGSVAFGQLPPPIVSPSYPGTISPPPAVTQAAAPAVRQEASGQRKLLNTTNAQIEYRIDTVGPSGVGRVDIYMTPDRGVTWTKLGENTNKVSPASVNLPGEGLYGIRLAITNGNGFGGRAPKSGDRPQYYIEVDATSPTVQLQPYEMVPNIGAMDIRWQATDANLSAEPVSIFYRSRTDASWRPIASNVKNDGTYRWTFPKDIDGQIFMKLEVTDMAGNITKVENPNPIMLDQTEPEVTLIDVNGVNNRAGAAPATPAPIALPTAFPGR